uniref:RING-type domain-containing protein n=1 Tax=Rhodosorus marinus TaxID=101924 RepID=A0A7S0G536_9RHOD|mmetsp:Transcript_3578/g.5085  ORF Transcript_3578/g.5085 Transcript_3578/m.5085 type:complete len:174 (+) Transcript_3578:107-628(+)
MLGSVAVVAIAGALLLGIGLAVTAFVTIEARKHSGDREGFGNQDERSVSRRPRLRAVVVLDVNTNDAIATTLEDVKDQLDQIGDHKAMVEPKDICSICLSEFDEEDGTKFVSSTCHHAYHLNCIGKWVYRRRNLACPICRTTFIPNEEDPTFEKFVAGEHSPENHVTEELAVT